MGITEAQGVLVCEGEPNGVSHDFLSIGPGPNGGPGSGRSDTTNSPSGAPERADRRDHPLRPRSEFKEERAEAPEEKRNA